MFDVVGIGLNAIDYLCCVPRYPVPGEKLRMTGFSRQGGGQVATALVALSRWGLRAMYVGNVGDDEHGRLSLFLLRQEGIDLSRARTLPGAVSQFAVILVQGDSGERTILWERDARLRIRPENIPREEIHRSHALLIDGHDVSASLESARQAGGAAGFAGSEFVQARGIRVEAADTTGAGDVFHAGFLFALLAGKPFPEILSFSNTAAGLSCRRPGGRAGIPSLAEIHRSSVRERVC